MTLAELLTLGGILVAALIAHLHRKQMRQNELFRLDPSVGVQPPPSPVVTFLKRHWEMIFVIQGIVLPLVSLAISIVNNQPVTLISVITVSLNVGTILYVLSFCLDMGLMRSIKSLREAQQITTKSLHEQMTTLVEIQTHTVESLNKHSELFSLVAKGVEIQTRLNELQQERLEQAAEDGKAP
jgi:hypothetical protein